MTYFRYLALLVLLLLFGIGIGQTQGQDFEIFFGETQSAFFDEGSLTHTWFFSCDCDSMQRQIPIIRANRIAGQFTPRLRLLDATGAVLAESSGGSFADLDELTFSAGLPDSTVFQIEVSALNIISNQRDNPAEYSLTVDYGGTRRASPDEGLNPLPSLGLEAVPNLREGESQRINLNVDVFGAAVTVSQARTPDFPSRFLVTDGQRELYVNQNIPIAGGVHSIAFLENGIGISLINQNFADDREFFSDENFTIAYNDVRREYTFTLESGKVIVSDFYRVESIEVRGGVVAFRMILGDSIKRMLFNNEYIDSRQLSAGEGETALNQIRLGSTPDAQFITSDLQNWDTLAYLEGELQVFYGADARFRSDTVRYFLRRDAVNPNLTSISLTIPEAGTARNLTITVDWQGVGEIRINADLLSYEQLNGVLAQEAYAELSNLLVENGAVQFSRRDGSFRSVFPDGTDINTPSQLADNSDLLPYEVGFRSRNFNDLGEDFFPLCPCVSGLQDTLPVNPVNGNFFYKVQDFNIPSAVLPLEFTRYYNSQDAGVSPRYLANSPVSYARLGNGWRHSYQHELDIAGAPLGRIRYVEPDGTQHYFFPVAGNPNRWTSRTLLSMVILREGGVLGTWRAIRSDGRSYIFDRVGRLSRISLAPDRSISLSPVPLAYSSAGSEGLFVVEPYGRRLELYIGASGRIETVRDSAARQLRYSYDEANQLRAVEYITPSQTATYEYNDLGLLARFDDIRSPYSQIGQIEYDARLRTEHYLENPNGDASRDYHYSYEQVEETRVTTRSFVVAGESRVQTWTYNALYQMTGLSLPRAGWVYEFSYDDSTGTLSTVRTPTLVRYVFFFDSRGNLTRYEDPFFTGERAFNFTYEQRGEVSILTRISHPNGRTDNFTWSEGASPQLIAHETLVFEGVNRQTRTNRYEYDDWGRLVMQVDPADVATVYQYDSFGYVESIWQGINLDTGETRANLTDSSRALRTLQFDYDLLGQVRAVTDGRGGNYTLNWDSSTEQLRQVNGPNDVYLIYSYDERGHVISLNDRGQETIYTYNGLDLVTSITDSQGSLLTFEYDEAGNLLRKVDDLQREWTYRYDALDNLTEARSPNNIVNLYQTERTPEGDFIVRREIDPIGRLIERRYDALERLRFYTITDTELGFSQTFRFDYDTIGYPSRIEETTTGRALNLEYNLVGEVTAIDVEGSRTTFAYDERGYLARVTSPEGRISQYRYDALGNVSQIILPDGSSWDYAYDENSNLLSAIDPTGIVSNYVYNALNQVVSEEDALGNSQNYSYDLRGNLTNIIDPRAISSGFVYDSQDRLITATDGRGQETSYEYDEIGRLFNIVQPGVRSTRLTYDLADNIIAVTERPREQRTLYGYDALGRITSITDPLGHTTTYQYNSVGRVSRVINAIGNAESYEWHPTTQYLTGYTSSAGRVYAINTDELGRPTLIRDTNTGDTEAINSQFFYDDDGYITGVQTGTDSARSSGTNDVFYQYEYSPNGYPARYTDPNGGVWNLLYDSAGRLLEYTNPNGVATQYVYDEVGRITQVINYAGTDAQAIETYEYDQNGNVTAYISPNGTRNEYIYNQNNRLAQARLAVGSPNESSYLFEYNSWGQLFYVSDSFDRQTRYWYSLDELIRIERDFGEDQIATSYDFDDAGNLRTVTLPERIEDVSLTYDALNRPVRYVNGESNTWSYTYDAAGNIAQISDPLGSVVAYSYDSYNRVSRIQYPSGSVATLAYDSAGNLRSLTLPPNVNGTNQTVTYRLDVMGNILEMQTGGSTTRFEYDALGNVTSRIAPDNSRTNYRYDAANRLIEIGYPNGTSVSYSYDTEGHLLTAGDSRFEYDAQGRMTLSENDVTIRYTYDALGNLLERDAGALGITSYSYDQLDRLERINFNGEEIQIVYDERSQIRQLIRSNGVQTALSYDAAGRPISIVHIAENERLDGFNYQYDAVGNLIRVDRIVDQYRILYSYDVDHRLIDERWLNEIGETVYSVRFRYDQTGNRIEENRNGRITNYSYDEQNRLIGEVRNIAPEGSEFIIIPAIGLGIGLALIVSRRRKLWWTLPCLLILATVGTAFAQTTPQINVTYSYDAAGNMNRLRYVRSDATYELTLSYDEENRLIAARGFDENGNLVDTAYGYDQFSRLIAWRSGESNYSFYYDGHEMIGMSDGESLESFLTLDEQRLLSIANGEVLWNLNDQIGSTRLYTDEAGQLVDDPSRILEFNSFGLRIYPYSEDRLAPEGAPVRVPSPFFGGNLYDPSTRLYVMGLRAYDPFTGRFLQPDPIRQDPVGTLYTFARNRPFVFGDGTGMMAEPYLDPFAASSINEQIEPESLIPHPTLPEFALAPTVHGLQADETFRALELLNQTYYGSNEMVGFLSPMLSDFYMNEVNPMPESLRGLASQPLERMMAVYQNGRWMPDPRPNPSVAKDPFDLIREVEPLLSQAYSQPLLWCFDNAFGFSPILPVLETPEGFNERWQVEQSLRDELQPMALTSALVPELAFLLNLPPEIVPESPIPPIEIPDASVEPAVLDGLDDLREESFDFISRIWSIGIPDCEDCVAPISFGH
jgi:RHS repeat-associated protein